MKEQKSSSDRDHQSATSVPRITVSSPATFINLIDNWPEPVTVRGRVALLGDRLELVLTQK